MGILNAKLKLKLNPKPYFTGLVNPDTILLHSTPHSVSGLLMKLPIFDAPRGAARPIMDDTLWWETPEDFPTPQALALKRKNGALIDKEDTNV